MPLCPLLTLLYLSSFIMQNEHSEIAKKKKKFKKNYSIRTYIFENKYKQVQTHIVLKILTTKNINVNVCQKSTNLIL